MKIAIVCPSPVPFTIGGFEKSIWDITEKINELTSHQAELIKVPSREDNFWDLIDSYHKFYELDLSHFDMVISTKYPSWMVSHPNHVCYMVHKLRGLYDTYQFTGYPMEVNTSCIYTKKLVQFLNDTWDRPDIDGFWMAINEFRSHMGRVPSQDTSFPGPLIRKIVHYMDNYALDTSRVRRYCTQSKTVANRADYFPKGVKVNIVYPPPANIKVGQISYGNYFFTVSRLDNAKRVHLLIDAMKHFNGDAKLIIAGTGPEEMTLKNKAIGDDRIEFRGYCSDREVAELYDNCLAVLYVPYDEDYGLVTVESFLRRKPVITCVDSGGTCEFVVNGENGLIVTPEPISIAKAMERLYSNKAEAVRMGNESVKKLKEVTWGNFINTLIPESIASAGTSYAHNKPKIIVTSTFPIYPPLGGGQSRIYNLYRNLAKSYDIEVLSFANYDQLSIDEWIAPGLREVRFPKSNAHHEKECEIGDSIGLPITDVVMPMLSHLTPEYGRALKQMSKDADIIIASHPYLYDEIVKSGNGRRMIYEAHNVEYDLKSQVLPPNGKKLLDEVYRVEKLCCQNSELIMTCCEADAMRLTELYGVDKGKIVVVPNGVDINKVRFVSRLEQKENKRKLGIEQETLVLFIGSWHPPNLEACREIFKMAEEMPDIIFLLMGSQCLAFKDKKIPKNVGLLGVLEEPEKDFIFSIVDLAINPVTSGSGTNLKMLDYMAAGIPVITTAFGARGLGIDNRCATIVDDVKDLKNAIMKAKDSDNSSKCVEARKIMETDFDWEIIAKKLTDRLDGAKII